MTFVVTRAFVAYIFPRTYRVVVMLGVVAIVGPM